MIELFEIDGRAAFRIKVVPGASRDRIMGELDGALKVGVSAPPEKGRANKAVVGLLARALGLRPSLLRIASGTTTAYKTCTVNTLSREQLQVLLGRLIAQ